MKSHLAVVFAAAVLSVHIPQAAAGDVFRAAVVDDATRSVLARAGGQLTAQAPGARLVVKAAADEQIRVQALGSAGEVLSEGERVLLTQIRKIGLDDAAERLAVVLPANGLPRVPRPRRVGEDAARRQKKHG